MTIMSDLAERIARSWLRKAGDPDWTTLRDFCHLHTDGDLDCAPLDVLTDMVMARVKSHARKAIAKAEKQP